MKNLQYLSVCVEKFTNNVKTNDEEFWTSLMVSIWTLFQQFSLKSSVNQPILYHWSGDFLTPSYRSSSWGWAWGAWLCWWDQGWCTMKDWECLIRVSWRINYHRWLNRVIIIVPFINGHENNISDLRIRNCLKDNMQLKEVRGWRGDWPDECRRYDDGCWQLLGWSQDNDIALSKPHTNTQPS